MPRRLTVGFSSCPNDVFIFEALISGLVDAPGLEFEPVIEDIETLNRLARTRELDLTKISFHAFGFLRDDYVLLDSGAALGRGCGPLLVARDSGSAPDLERARIGIPGELTTAALLLRLWSPQSRDLRVLNFAEIPQAVADGRLDAGVIIHESRFTYERLGLRKLVDLGSWWESQADLPIPLGGIIADRRLGPDVIRDVDRRLRESIELARREPGAVWEAIRTHAQELEEEVIRSHIDLYVNDFTLTLGEEGRRAIEYLLEAAQKEELIPRSNRSPFDPQG